MKKEKLKDKIFITHTTTVAKAPPLVALSLGCVS